MRGGERLHQLNAIHSRHHNIGDHHIYRRATGADQFECLRAVPGFQDQEALALEHSHRESTDRAFVIHHENRDAGISTQRCRGPKLVEGIHAVSDVRGSLTKNLTHTRPGRHG